MLIPVEHGGSDKQYLSENEGMKGINIRKYLPLLKYAMSVHIPADPQCCNICIYYPWPILDSTMKTDKSSSSASA